jgi:hypothetical protein
MSDSDKRQLLNFILNAPAEEKIVNMDCNDGCEQLARLAEMVVNGAKLEDVLPELEKHMCYWKDCREEFDALVAILKAEQCGKISHDHP